jgi:hypothetical protein
MALKLDRKVYAAFVAGVLAVGGPTVAWNNATAQQETKTIIKKYLKSIDSTYRAEGFARVCNDSVLDPAVDSLVIEDVVDTLGVPTGEKRQVMRQVRWRRVKNVDDKYACPEVTNGKDVFIVSMIRQRDGVDDTTLYYNVSKPIADRYIVVYTTTTEK